MGHGSRGMSILWKERDQWRERGREVMQTNMSKVYLFIYENGTHWFVC